MADGGGALGSSLTGGVRIVDRDGICCVPGLGVWLAGNESSDGWPLGCIWDTWRVCE